VKREVLLEAVRDEQGNVFLSITKTRISMRMPPRFWKKLIKRIERLREKGEYFHAEDLERSGKVIEMVKAALEKPPTKR